MSPILKATHVDRLDDRIPGVVVVDPHFEKYTDLAASARSGKLTLHFRSSGAEAIQLSRRLKVDAWLIAHDLDDMAGADLLELLQGDAGHPTLAMVADPAAPGATSADATLQHPITLGDLERLLGLTSEERSTVLSSSGIRGPFVTLPVGVGAAFVAIAVLMLT